MKTVIVCGANGQLATEYEQSAPSEHFHFIFLSRKELDISKMNQVEKAFAKYQPEVIINLAAYTNVEKAEKEEAEKSFLANAEGPKNLAIMCKLKNIPLIHISTDYVFDGTKTSAYVEADTENPINNYGRTKFLGEKWIQENHDWFYILRVSWVYSNHSKNFYTTMLSLAQERTQLNIVDDQIGSPTSTKEICRAIDSILSRLEKDFSGVYHFCGLGKTTWKDFAEEIFHQSRISVIVNGVSSDKWPSNVKRPNNSQMSSLKFSKTFGYYPQHWKNALTEIIAERKIFPVKVGDSVILKDEKFIIVSTDWSKKIAILSSLPLNNESRRIEMPFESLTAV